MLEGDFSARIGKYQSSTIVGSYGEVIINDNGMRLIDLASQFDLEIMNGSFDHKEIHKYAWYQDVRGLNSIIY